MRAGPPRPSPRPSSLPGQHRVAAEFRTPEPSPAPHPGFLLPASARGSAVDAAFPLKPRRELFQQRGGNTQSTLPGKRGSFWDARRTHRPFPSARGLLPTPRGRARRAAGRVQVGSPLLGGRGGLRAALGTPHPGCVGLRVAAFVGDLGALSVLGWGGADTSVFVKVQARDRTNSVSSVGGPGRVALTKSETGVGHLPLPHLRRTATRGRGGGGRRRQARPVQAPSSRTGADRCHHPRHLRVPGARFSGPGA